MPVAVHTGAPEGCKQAIHFGARSLEHAYLIDSEGLAMAEQSGTYVVPTMQMTQEDLHQLQDTTLPCQAVWKFRRDNEKILASQRLLAASGVSKVVPTLSGVYLRRANSLWPTLVLLNLGNVLRIGTEIATDYTPHAYAVMSISGFIELAGLALWGLEMIRNILFAQHLVRNPGTRVPVPVAGDWVLGPQTRISKILERYPDTLPIFLRRGFTPLANPTLRRTVARIVTVEQVCRREAVDLDAFLEELRSSVKNSVVLAGLAELTRENTRPEDSVSHSGERKQPRG